MRYPNVFFISGLLVFFLGITGCGGREEAGFPFAIQNPDRQLKRITFYDTERRVWSDTVNVGYGNRLNPVEAEEKTFNRPEMSEWNSGYSFPLGVNA